MSAVGVDERRVVVPRRDSVISNAVQLARAFRSDDGVAGRFDVRPRCWAGGLPAHSLYSGVLGLMPSEPCYIDRPEGGLRTDEIPIKLFP